MVLALATGFAVCVVSTLVAEDALEEYQVDTVELSTVEYNCSADLVCDCEYCDQFPDCANYLYTYSYDVTQCCAKSADCGYQNFK